MATKAIISLTEFPVSHTDGNGNSCFRALGRILNMRNFPRLDSTDNIVLVYWEVTNEKAEHEIDQCDWFRPTSVEHTTMTLMEGGFCLKGMFEEPK